jgi:hypothetical protein
VSLSIKHGVTLVPSLPWLVKCLPLGWGCISVFLCNESSLQLCQKNTSSSSWPPALLITVYYHDRLCLKQRITLKSLHGTNIPAGTLQFNPSAIPWFSLQEIVIWKCKYQIKPEVHGKRLVMVLCFFSLLILPICRWICTQRDRRFCIEIMWSKLKSTTSVKHSCQHTAPTIECKMDSVQKNVNKLPHTKRVMLRSWVWTLSPGF